MRAVIVASLASAIMLVHGAAPLNAAETLTCSTLLDITTCSSPNGYTSHTTQWQGRTNGWDNRGDTWSTSRWRDNETTSITPPEQ
jgi:hypothetical protein